VSKRATAVQKRNHDEERAIESGPVLAMEEVARRGAIGRSAARARARAVHSSRWEETARPVRCRSCRRLSGKTPPTPRSNCEVSLVSTLVGEDTPYTAEQRPATCPSCRRWSGKTHPTRQSRDPRRVPRVDAGRGRHTLHGRRERCCSCRSPARSTRRHEEKGGVGRKSTSRVDTATRGVY
jgi:hypothetical protein